jgi:hypothetical protein
VSDDWSALLAGLQADTPKTETAEISQAGFDAFFSGLAAIPVAPETETISAEAYAGFLANVAEPSKFAPTGEGLDGSERKKKHRAKMRKLSIDNIAVLDFETDPFDNLSTDEIKPFTACLYSDNFEPVIIWEEDEEKFVDGVIEAIESLPESYTIYAHNGGKFDYMFLLRRLKGEVMFKGRGIMTATVGKHQLRDSFHIIPDRLANYKKDHIDYSNMKKNKRHKFKQQIIAYMISDCKYLLDLVKGFATRFGLKLSIGQAAMVEIRKHYKFERLEEWQDAFFRDYFFGGRVECITGKRKVTGDWKLYDVNSMYPYVMAHYEHPIGNMFIKRKEKITDDTFFIDITCDSKGAFILKDGDKTHAPHGRHRFKTTIWEYRVAKKHNLISNEEIHGCIDIPNKTNFAKFVAPLYNERQHLKAKIAAMKTNGQENTPEFDEAVKDDMFMKFLLNNGYGKFAQNPRKYKEHYLTAVGEAAPENEGWLGPMMFDDYWLWHKPNPGDRFNNVATGASITGAARAELLDAICNAVEPIYCDTDSIICKDLPGVKIHKTDLGAWDLEKELSEVIINGRKLYSYTEKGTNKLKTKAKGAGNILTAEQWAEIIKLEENKQENQKGIFSYANMNAIYEGGEVLSLAMGTTLTKSGNQYYMKRRISATTQTMQG